jgi:hypothetical protein
MTLNEFIGKFNNVRTTTLGYIGIAIAGLTLLEGILRGDGSIDWNTIGGFGLLGTLGISSKDGAH